MASTSEDKKFIGIEDIAITWREDANGRLYIQTDTPRLMTRTVMEEDFENYCRLFSCEATVESYGDGKPWTREHMRKVFDRWLEAWNPKDPSKKSTPFSGFACFAKDVGPEPVFTGHWIVSNKTEMVGIPGDDAHQDKENEYEFSAIGFQKYWGSGYGMHGFLQMLFRFIPEAYARGYFDEQSKLYMTTRTDNGMVRKIMGYIGFKKEDTITKWGVERDLYKIYMKALADLSKAAEQEYEEKMKNQQTAVEELRGRTGSMQMAQAAAV